MEPDPRSVGDPADPAALEVLATQALTLGVLVDRLEQDDGGHPHLVAAAALLAPGRGATEADRARAAAREVLRPVARELLAEVLRRSGAGAPGEVLAPGGVVAPPPGGGASDAAPAVTGTVHDRAGRAVPGAVVLLLDPGGEVLASDRAAADGSYHLTAATGSVAAPPGTVVAHAPGFHPDAAAVTGPRAVGPLALVGAAHLDGRVRLADGAPPPPTRILLLDTGGIVVARARTDPGGRFTLDGLGPGTYTVATTGDPPAATTVRLGPAAASTVDLLLPAPAGRLPAP